MTSASSYNLTTNDVAARYGIGEYAVRRLVRSEQLRAIKFAGKLRFSERDLLAFEKRSATSRATGF